jgi:hypothetical protein
MKSLLKMVVCVLFLMNSKNSSAQTAYPFPQPGTLHCEAFTDLSVFQTSGVVRQYLGDTICAGDTLARFCRPDHPASSSSSCGNGYEFYTRYSNGKIFFRFSPCSQEYLYYDFNLSVGDTFAIYNWGNAIVDTVSTRLCLNGQTRKYIRLHEIDGFSVGNVFRWIDGVGDIDLGLMYPWWIDGINNFVCLSDNTGKVWENSQAPLDCDSLVSLALPVASISKKQNNFSIYPNPTNGNNIVLDFGTPINSPLQVDILDVNGQIVFSEKGFAAGKEKKISLPQLTSGCYFVRCTIGENTFYKKLIKQ